LAMRDQWHSTAAAAPSEPMMRYLFLNLLPVGLFRFAGRGSGHAAARAGCWLPPTFWMMAVIVKLL
jgi:hypothetical protein